MRKRMFAALPFLLLLTSCVGEEPNDIAYVTALGIDKADNEYVYTIQFANPTKISGGAAEEGGSGGDIVENIAVEAPTIYSAINNANTIVSKYMSLSHAKVIVISEEIATEGIREINDVIARNNDIRPDVFIAVAENAGKYLEEVKPAIELNPIKYYQLTYENRSGSSVPQNNAFNAYTAYISGDSDCVIPLAGVAGGEEEQSSEGSSGGSGGSESSGGESNEEPKENPKQKEASANDGGFENKTKSYLAGEAGKKLKNKSETIGMAIFDGDKYVTKFGNTETELYNILMGTFKEDNIVFYSEDSPDKPITIQVEEKKHPVYKIDKNNKKAEIYIKLEGELLSASEEHRDSSGIDDIDKSTAEMVTKAANNFIRTVYKDNNVDSLGICGRLKKKFVTTKKYNDYKKEFNPSDWDIKVHSEMKIKRTGMTYYY